jgi:hypothetical protein
LSTSHRGYLLGLLVLGLALAAGKWARPVSGPPQPAAAVASPILTLPEDAAAAEMPKRPVALNPRPGGPAIQVRETSRNDGVVEEGTVVRYRFSVANEGKADLIIRKVKPSCGCSVARWDKLIKPGAQGVIEAEMHTEQFSGPVTKHLTVHSNDPAQPQLELPLFVRVRPIVRIQPGTGALIALDDRPVSRQFTLERAGGRPMKILGVASDAPYVKATTTRMPGVGRFKLEVTADTSAPLGRSTVPVTVATDQPKMSLLVFTLTIDRGIVAVPPQVFWNLAPGPLKPATRSVVTIRGGARPFHVSGVTIDDPKVQTSLETIRDGREYRVTLLHAGGWEPGSVRRTLTATTDDPKQRTLKIPLQAVVRHQPSTPGPL